MASILTLLDTAEPPHMTMKPRPGTLSIPEITRKVEATFANSEAPRFTRELSRAAVLLWHDHFDAAHEIAQDIENANGSFLHGILHRREPDYMNARYWFRRVGHTHPAFDCIVGKIKVAMLNTSKNMDLVSKQIIPNDKWDPMRFIDFLEDALKNKDETFEKFLRQVQAAEINCYLLSLPNH